MQTDLTGASTKLKLYQVDNMAYPTLINSCPTPTAGNICLKASPGNTYSYSVVNNTNPQTYSLTASNTNGKAYAVTQNSGPVVSTPPAPLVVYPQTFGATGNYTVPAAVISVTLEVWGGDDGYYYGGYAKGTLAVSPGDVLNVTIGTYDNSGAGSRDGGSSSVKRPAGANLLLATGAWNDGVSEGDVGYGYTYAGVTSPLVSSNTNSGAPRAVITYTTGG